LISDFLSNIKGLIIDMDGVLWRDKTPLGDLPAIFSRIRDAGLRMILATNNATRSVEDYHTKLKGFGVELEDWQIINSAQATGIYLQKHFPSGCSVYVVGQPGLKETLKSYGCTVHEDGISNVQAVVAAMDQTLTYEKLKQATLLIRSGSFFIGTNPDTTYPTPEGLIPGAGTVVGALEIASGQKAKVIGKPEPYLYEMAMDLLGLTPGETLAIGDRLETDIAGAQAAGIHTALVLSGVSTLEQARQFDPIPEIIANDLTELIS